MARFYRRLGGQDELPIEMVKMAPAYLSSIDAEQEMEDETPSPDYETVLPSSYTFDRVQFKPCSWKFLYAIVVELFVQVLEDGNGEHSGDGEMMSWVKVAHRESVPLIMRVRGRPACVLEHGTRHCCRKLQCPEGQPLIRFQFVKTWWIE